jgi:hypothetical protein
MIRKFKNFIVENNKNYILEDIEFKLIQLDDNDIDYTITELIKPHENHLNTYKSGYFINVSDIDHPLVQNLIYFFRKSYKVDNSYLNGFLVYEIVNMNKAEILKYAINDDEIIKKVNDFSDEIFRNLKHSKADNMWYYNNKKIFQHNVYHEFFYCDQKIWWHFFTNLNINKNEIKIITKALFEDYFNKPIYTPTYINL